MTAPGSSVTYRKGTKGNKEETKGLLSKEKAKKPVSEAVQFPSLDTSKAE